MSNMSYCRFENTAGDVDDCIEALQEGESLSESELAAAKEMFTSIVDYMVDEVGIDVNLGLVLTHLDQFKE